jgi:hypothetical protein
MYNQNLIWYVNLPIKKVFEGLGLGFMLTIVEHFIQLVVGFCCRGRKGA